jgi:hypothetical protein
MQQQGQIGQGDSSCVPFLCEDFKILYIKAIVIFKAKMKLKTWKMEIIIKLFLKIKTEKNFFFQLTL